MRTPSFTAIVAVAVVVAILGGSTVVVAQYDCRTSAGCSAACDGNSRWTSVKPQVRSSTAFFAALVRRRKACARARSSQPRTICVGHNACLFRNENERVWTELVSRANKPFGKSTVRNHALQAQARASIGSMNRYVSFGIEKRHATCTDSTAESPHRT